MYDHPYCIDLVLKTRTKLLQFLDESTFYKAERILSRLPVDGKLDKRTDARSAEIM